MKKLKPFEIPIAALRIAIKNLQCQEQEASLKQWFDHASTDNPEKACINCTLTLAIITALSTVQPGCIGMDVDPDEARISDMVKALKDTLADAKRGQEKIGSVSAWVDSALDSIQQ